MGAKQAKIQCNRPRRLEGGKGRDLSACENPSWLFCEKIRRCGALRGRLAGGQDHGDDAGKQNADFEAYRQLVEAVK